MDKDKMSMDEVLFTMLEHHRIAFRCCCGECEFRYKSESITCKSGCGYKERYNRVKKLASEHFVDKTLIEMFD